MAFQVEELSIQLVEALVPLMPRIRQRDKSLEDLGEHGYLRPRVARERRGMPCAKLSLGAL